MTDNTQQAGEREAFEQHYERMQGYKPRLWSAVFASALNNPEMPANLEGMYLMREQQQAWEAWQARAALSQPTSDSPAAEGGAETCDRCNGSGEQVGPSDHMGTHEVTGRCGKCAGTGEAPPPAAAQGDAVSDDQLWALRGLAPYNAVDETRSEFIERVRTTLATKLSKNYVADLVDTLQQLQFILGTPDQDADAIIAKVRELTTKPAAAQAPGETFFNPLNHEQTK